MAKKANIGIIGDYVRGLPAHRATEEALLHAADRLGCRVNISWVPTISLTTDEGQRGFGRFDAVWAAPGGAYESMEGALWGIQTAREEDRPFFGT